jgi:hypothetical protein
MKVMLMDCSYLNLNSMLCKLHQQILPNLNLNSMEIIYLNLNSTEGLFEAASSL